ncbi:DUF6262 family protein [Mycobacterium antarcticum]|uniref:DUF6262 family protein n=1 Tax=Mycolicibacterium sp. TUM20983 TaxID=3023369 RepID=UPI0032EA42BE
MAARHRDTQAALSRVRDIIARLRREKTPLSVAAVARVVGVSRTFPYTNPDTKTTVTEAIRESGGQRSRPLAEADDSREATWRDRALNAQDALKNAYTEIATQRSLMGELLGRIRDLEADGRRMTSSGSRPRTPASNSVSESSPPPGPTCGSRRLHRRPRSPDR